MWEYGIQKEKVEEVDNEKLHEFKLAGTPWVGEGEESTMCRLLLLQLVGRLARDDGIRNNYYLSITG